jgi:hypothetical protein
MALSVAALNACGAVDGGEDSEADESLATTEQAIIPGAAVTQAAKGYVVPANGALSNATVNCATGSIVVGGGHFMPPSGNLRVHASHSSANGWSISVINLSPTTATPIDVYAECLSGTNASSSSVWSPVTTLGPGQFASRTHRCPFGTILSGGGFAASIAIHAFYNYPNQDGSVAQWTMQGVNKNSVGSSTFQTQAVCLSGVTGRTTIQSVNSPSIPAGAQVKFNSNLCPSGTLLSSGGFHNFAFAPNQTAKGNLRNFQNPFLWTTIIANNQTSAITAVLNTACLELWAL